MASPWIPSQRSPAERPLMGMMMLAAIPLLSLILIRMLWSGSSLWFLTAGIMMLGAAAVVFLARRPQEHEYGRPAGEESHRIPLVLMALGVLFLAMLLLPNFAGGDSKSSTLRQSPQQPSTGVSDVAGSVQQPSSAQQHTAPVNPAAPATDEVVPPTDVTSTDVEVEPPAVTGESYIVEEGDTLWDIAVTFGTTVEAIVGANGLENAEDIQIGQELIIPPPEEGDTAAEEQPVEDQAGEPVGVAE